MKCLSRSLKIISLSLMFVFVTACCGQGAGLLRSNRMKIAQAMRSTVALVREKAPEDGTGFSGRPYCTAFWISRTELVSAAHCFTNRASIGGFSFTLPTQYLGKEARFVSYGQIDDNGDIVDGIDPQMANIVWASESQDVVVLKARNNPRSHPWFRMAQSLPKAGEDVYIVGHPIGLTWSFTAGIVTRVWRFRDKKPSTVIQTDAVAYFGNSGGPLINNNGEVIGVCHALWDGQSTINWHVGINEVRKGLRTLRNHH